MLSATVLTRTIARRTARAPKSLLSTAIAAGDDHELTRGSVALPRSEYAYRCRATHARRDFWHGDPDPHCEEHHRLLRPVGTRVRYRHDGHVGGRLLPPGGPLAQGLPRTRDPVPDDLVLLARQVRPRRPG